MSLDPGVRWLDAATLLGGAPRRRVRLSAAGIRELTALRAGVGASLAGRELARRLLDAGLLHPRPAPVTGPLDVTVIIPVRDRTELLEQALASLTEAVRVVVVDDGSSDAGAVRRVAGAHGAELVRRDAPSGPAAARNAGARLAHSAFIAFLDSDCQAPAGWLAQLLGHFADASVAAVAPRILAAGVAQTTSLARYLALRSPLDMGRAAGPVGPVCRVRYLPSAALILRRSALGTGFDEALAVGEDVDLVWRLHDAGWQVRYDPSVVVAHREPSRLRDALRRRFRYGTSAGPLAARHGARLTPAILGPEVAVAGAALLAGRPRLAGTLGAGAFSARVRVMRGTGLPRSVAIAWSAAGLAGELTGGARFLAGPGWPATLALAARRPVVAIMVLLGPALGDWHRLAHRLNPCTFVPFAVLDDAAYGTGVVVGSLHSLCLTGLIPRLASPLATALHHRWSAWFRLTLVHSVADVRRPSTRPNTSQTRTACGRASPQALDPALTAAGAGSSVDGRSGG